jgi:hypothetical protein
VTAATMLEIPGVGFAIRSLGNLFKRFGTGSALVVWLLAHARRRAVAA